MCGACGVTPQDWAGPILATSYAKPLVARLLAGITPALRVRATGVGWTVGLAGRPSTVCISSELLLEHTARLLNARGVEGTAVETAILQAPAHRAVATTREMFPIDRTDSASGEARPVPATQVILALLAGSLTSRMISGGERAEVVMGDRGETWTLLVS